MAQGEWVSTAAGRHLSGRSKRDTRPELLLRSAVHRLGLRYAVQKKLARGCTPDIVLVRHRVAVFVDGCFWHQCPEHGRTKFIGPNAHRWTEKMRNNKARDQRADELAYAAGYRVLRLWECAVVSDPQAAADVVRTAALARRSVDSRPARPAPGQPS